MRIITPRRRYNRAARSPSGRKRVPLRPHSSRPRKYGDTVAQWGCFTYEITVRRVTRYISPLSVRDIVITFINFHSLRIATRVRNYYLARSLSLSLFLSRKAGWNAKVSLSSLSSSSSSMYTHVRKERERKRIHRNVASHANDEKSVLSVSGKPGIIIPQESFNCDRGIPPFSSTTLVRVVRSFFIQAQ